MLCARTIYAGCRLGAARPRCDRRARADTVRGQEREPVLRRRREAPRCPAVEARRGDVASRRLEAGAPFRMLRQQDLDRAGDRSRMLGIGDADPELAAEVERLEALRERLHILDVETGPLEGLFAVALHLDGEKGTECGVIPATTLP